MYLTLDIGNTRTKYAVFSLTGNLAASGTVDNNTNIGSEFHECLAIGFCNVSDQFSPDLGGFPGPVMELNAEVELPFRNDYLTPHTLGADRIAAAAGAMHLYPSSDLIVVDAGTCLKVDFVSKDGVYHGGSISPGLKMRYKSLHHFTGRLPEINHHDFEAVTGKSTEESILLGVQAGYVAENESHIERLKQQAPGAKVIYTGGDHGFLANRAKNRIFAEPLLLHYGIFHCLRLNGY